MKSITILKTEIITHWIFSGGDGAEAIYALRDKDTLARMILEEMAKVGQNIRKWYQRRLPSDTSQDYYFIQRNTGLTEPVIVEYGFLDNATDASFIKTHWQQMAEAVVKAVAMYKGIPYSGILAEGTYVVQKGDTLWSVAKKLNVSVTALKTANNLTTNTLSIGQILTVPTTVPTPPPTGNTYTVRSGDSLYVIASKYNTTVDELKVLNGLTSNTLSIGQILKVPSVGPVTPSANTYTVVSGDNLYSIARRFGVSTTELRDFNNLTSDTLSIGQVLLIPVTEPTPPSETITHTVVSGDNLYSIADTYGVTVDEIKRTNNLTSNTLSIGQTLIIPKAGGTAPSETTIYTVVRGDSLYSIASKFGTTTNELMQLNNLSSSLLSIGQELKIPAMATTGQTYTVRSGDSLWSIANKFGVSISDIRTANGLTTDLLSIGQVLVIP